MIVVGCQIKVVLMVRIGAVLRVGEIKSRQILADVKLRSCSTNST